MRYAILSAFLLILGLPAFASRASAQIDVRPLGAAAVKAARDQIRMDRPAGDPAPAGGGELVTTFSPEQVAELAKKIGIQKVEFVEDKSWGRLVTGEAHGVPVTLWPCDQNGRCTMVSLHAYFGKQDGVDAKFVTAFNDRYITKLVKYDDTGRVTLHFNIPYWGGVTEEHIRTLASIFLSHVKAAIEFKPS